jgi:hypothetical protein
MEQAQLGLFPATPLARPQVQFCPVGCCVPDTARAVQVEERGQLCSRHRKSVGVAQLQKLDLARKRRAGDLEPLLADAVELARQNDRHWAPWLIVWTFIKGRRWHRSDRGEVRGVEKHFDGRRALRRALDLDSHNCVEFVCGRTGERMTPTQALVGTPHQIEDRQGKVIGEGNSLSSALALARTQSLANVGAGCQARSLVTHRTYTITEARTLLERAKQ